MGCMLRVGGVRFDAAGCAETTTLPVVRVHRRGEPVFSTRPRGKKKSTSSLNVLVSRAQFHQLAKQITDAQRFLKRHTREIKRVMRKPGVRGAALDFGIARRHAAAQFDRFPPELLLMCGKLGIALEVSWYQAWDE
jgi:hypothetical protein